MIVKLREPENDPDPLGLLCAFGGGLSLYLFLVIYVNGTVDDPSIYADLESAESADELVVEFIYECTGVCVVLRWFQAVTLVGVLGFTALELGPGGAEPGAGARWPCWLLFVPGMLNTAGEGPGIFAPESPITCVF